MQPRVNALLAVFFRVVHDMLSGNKTTVREQQKDSVIHMIVLKGFDDFAADDLHCSTSRMLKLNLF